MGCAISVRGLEFLLESSVSQREILEMSSPSVRASQS